MVVKTGYRYGVHTLKIDSANFTQIEKQAMGDEKGIAVIMLDIVAKQGKHRNLVTGSGSSLLGVVEKMGEALQGKINLKVSDKFPTLELSPLTQLLH